MRGRDSFPTPVPTQGHLEWLESRQETAEQTAAEVRGLIGRQAALLGRAPGSWRLSSKGSGRSANSLEASLRTLRPRSGPAHSRSTGRRCRAGPGRFNRGGRVLRTRVRARRADLIVPGFGDTEFAVDSGARPSETVRVQLRGRN